MKGKQLQEWLFDRLDGARWYSGERYFSAWCPFESHQRPALLVFEDGYSCRSCENAGSLEYLKSQVDSGIASPLADRSSYKSVLPKWRNWQKQYDDISGIALAAHRIAKENNMRGYFKRRKIDQFFEEGMFGRLDGWYTFPVFDKEQQIIDIVVRAGKGKKETDAKYVVCPYSESELRPLYVPNWERVLGANRLFVVFGIITAWALEAVELPCVTGITGKSLDPRLLANFHMPITVIPDYNEEREGARLANKLGWSGIYKQVDYPDNCSDLDDVRTHYGNDALISAIGA